ncbi:MAG TPA: ubiquinone/menaquinone biosynthesis methyltransferase [Kiritimatiellia bacterium]|nr:ubiquinone/menaquinone biosynthesis methyltransferase [Kiritimatiellia bacterium]
MKTFTLQSRDYIDQPDRKRFYNEQLFTEVAPRYDLITRLLSFGRDPAWKKAMLSGLPPVDPDVCVDIACGTGDIVAALHKKYPYARIIGIDLTPAMIKLASDRIGGVGVGFEVGDMSKLRLENNSVDVITGGYALRNAPDLQVVLQELYRVLKPGGIAAFLDFSKPGHRIGQTMSYRMLKIWGGLWGRLLHRNSDVYGYIAESLARYPDRQKLRSMMADNGLPVINSRAYFGGMLEWMICRKLRE